MTNTDTRLKRLNLPVEQIIQMVNENTKRNIASNKAKSMESTNRDGFADPLGAFDYDSDDDILDPKTEIHLVTIKSDETEYIDFIDSQTEEQQNIPISTWHTPQIDAVPQQAKSSQILSKSQNAKLPDLEGNMLDHMRSQFQNGTNPLNPSKHKCLMAGTSEITIASEYCTVERPCVMNLDKMSLHYVIHYIKRGVWDKVVPELVEADKPRIDSYQCNICEKKFRNNHSKEEYPGRGSFICHLATEHGKIIDAMRNDDVVDMKPVIDILDKSDDRLGKFVRDGTKTAHDHDLVKVVESITWRIQQDGFNIRTPASHNQRKVVKSIIKCPKCKEFDRNKDPNNLKLHIFHHYLEFWAEKVPKMTKKDTVCDRCTPLKRIVGANPEGCRTAMICHRAIHHGELRTVLENDKDLPEGFIEELFGEVSVKPVKVMHAGKTNGKADEEGADNTKSEQEVKEERERIAQEVRKREMMRIFEKRKKEEKVKTSQDGKGEKRKRPEESKKERDERLENKMLELQKRLEDNTESEEGQRLQMLRNFRIQKSLTNNKISSDAEDNGPYVGKRIKQNLKNLSFDDDSDEDVEWTKKLKKANPDYLSATNLENLSRKILPKRQVAPTKIVINDGSEDEWDTMHM